MAKTLNFTYDGKDYSIGFTLATVTTMQRAGFILDEVATKPAVRIPELFYGAFMANHKGIKRKLVEDIYDNMKHKEELVTALIELYDEAQASLVDEGNGEWTLSE